MRVILDAGDILEVQIAGEKGLYRMRFEPGAVIVQATNEYRLETPHSEWSNSPGGDLVPQDDLDDEEDDDDLEDPDDLSEPGAREVFAEELMEALENDLLERLDDLANNHMHVNTTTSYRDYDITYTNWKKFLKDSLLECYMNADSKSIEWVIKNCSNLDQFLEFIDENFIDPIIDLRIADGLSDDV